MSGLEARCECEATGTLFYKSRWSNFSINQGLVGSYPLDGRIHCKTQHFAIFFNHTAAIVVEHELVHQFTMVLDQPVHPVEGAAFFSRAQRQNDVAIGLVAFLLHADQRCYHDGVASFMSCVPRP